MVLLMKKMLTNSVQKDENKKYEYFFCRYFIFHIIYSYNIINLCWFLWMFFFSSSHCTNKNWEIYRDHSHFRNHAFKSQNSTIIIYSFAISQSKLSSCFVSFFFCMNFVQIVIFHWKCSSKSILIASTHK